MKLFEGFIKESPGYLALSLLLGIASGACYSVLIPVLIDSIAPAGTLSGYVAPDIKIIHGIEVINPKLAGVFLGLCLVVVVSRLVSKIVLIRISINLSSRIRSQLCQMILAAPIKNIEKIGPSRLQSVLNDDVSRLVGGSQVLPNMLTNLVAMFGTLMYLAYVDTQLFFYVLALIVIGVTVYQIPIYIGNQLFRSSRAAHDQMQEVFRGLVYGAKELKLSSSKRQVYLRDVLGSTEQALVGKETLAYSTFAAAEIYGDMVVFLVLGFVGFVFVNYYPISSTDLMAVTMAILYVTAPIAGLMSAIPQISQARSSFENIGKVRALLEGEPLGVKVAEKSWSRMSFEQVCFRHASADSSNEFSIGPISIDFRKREIVFISGGNGSGKSTFGKILSLHYSPDAGSIFFDAIEVSKENISSYRDQVAAIYSDYFLFDRILAKLNDERLALIARHLSRLGLSDKITIENGRFSTIKLSDGQRRRLALLVMLVEDKELYVFDEWAADQDSLFKDYFYREFLQELKNQNKLVVVISHDDRYFDVADRIIKFERGMVVDRSASASHA